MRRATRANRLAHAPPEVSIHALLAESDAVVLIVTNQCRGFYPRSPCGERLVHALELADTMLFLSTLSLRRATANTHRGRQEQHGFYPRSPCGERHLTNYHFTLLSHVSIHALLAESDALATNHNSLNYTFLSTLSLRRATIRNAEAVSKYMMFLSTLSLRRATPAPIHHLLRWWSFYPRSPCGERHCTACQFEIICLFLSTLSLRRATINDLIS